MSDFHYKNGELYTENVPVKTLAEQYGTPLYVYSAAHLRTQAGQLKTALSQHLPADANAPLICFACKANSNIAVLDLLKQEGLGTDIVSLGEYTRARQAGISPDKIVFSGVGKTDTEIETVLKNGIHQINVESEPELERIARIAEKHKITAPVAFRFNPDVDAKTHAKITTGKHENKFGLTRDALIALYQKADAHAFIAPKGITSHIGSQLTAVTPFKDAFTRMRDLVEMLRAMDMPVTRIDIGGGLGITYTDETPPDLDDYARMVAEIIAPLGTQIILEPGRFIAGNCGILVSQVVHVKQGEKKHYLILDAGMNDLARPSIYDAYHPVMPVLEDKAAEHIAYDIVGPVCETGDTFGKNIPLPVMEEDDFVAMTSSGAYGFVMASNYNTRPLPAEILVDGDTHRLIRRRQTVDDILALEMDI